jgi:hypothetical protein
MTIGLEEILQPTFSVTSLILNEKNNIFIRLADVQIHDFNPPSDIGDRIQNMLEDEIKKNLRTKMDDRWFEVVLKRIGGAIALIPIANFSDWMTKQLTENSNLTMQIEKTFREKFRDQIIFTVPESFPIGFNDEYFLTLSNDDPLEVSVAGEQLVVDIKLDGPSLTQ